MPNLDFGNIAVFKELALVFPKKIIMKRMDMRWGRLRYRGMDAMH